MQAYITKHKQSSLNVMHVATILAENVGLSPHGAQSREIPQKIAVLAVQGHPTSSILMPIETAYATSY